MKSFFISYARGDQKWSNAIKNALLNNPENRVFTDEELCPGDDWQDVVTSKIEQCDVMIAIISNRYVHSTFCQRELSYKLECSGRATLQIVPIFIERLDTQITVLQEYDFPMQYVYADEEDTPDSLAERVYLLFNAQDRIAELYSAAEEYRYYGSYYDACMCCQEIIHLLKDNSFGTPDQLITIYNRMRKILQESYEYYNASTDFHDAKVSYLQALQLSREYYGEDHPLIASIYNDLGTLYKNAMPDEALIYYNKAYEILKKIHGDNGDALFECEKNIESLQNRMSQGNQESVNKDESIL